MSPIAINTFNGLFYSSFAGDIYDTGLAQLYSHNPEISQAFAQLFNQLIPNQKCLHVKHLSAGSRAEFIWNQIGQSSSQKYQVEISDIVKPSLNTNFVRNCELTATAHDLRSGLSEVTNRFDFIFATYSFDSIWFPEDAYYLKEGNNWFKVTYQLQVSQSPETPAYITSYLRTILANNSANIARLPASYFKALEFQEHRQPIDINTQPYGPEIANYYQDHERAQCAFPGGMIRNVKQIFQTQLKPHGAVVLGEVIIPDHQTMARLINRPLGLQRSGSIARYKIEDYGLAQKILATEGYKMEFISIADFIAPHAPKSKLATYQQISDTNHIVTIRRTN